MKRPMALQLNDNNHNGECNTQLPGQQASIPTTELVELSTRHILRSVPPVISSTAVAPNSATMLAYWCVL